MATLDVVLLNNGDKSTFIRGEPSFMIDLIFAKGNCSWDMFDTDTASDHCAIIWTESRTSNIRRKYQRTNAIGWKVSLYDETTFMVSLDKNPANGQNAERKANGLIEKIVKASDANMPQKQNSYQLTEQMEIDKIPPITEEQLMEACNKVGNKKASGMDLI